MTAEGAALVAANQAHHGHHDLGYVVLIFGALYSIRILVFSFCYVVLNSDIYQAKLINKACRV